MAFGFFQMDSFYQTQNWQFKLLADEVPAGTVLWQPSTPDGTVVLDDGGNQAGEVYGLAAHDIPAKEGDNDVRSIAVVTHGRISKDHFEAVNGAGSATTALIISLRKLGIIITDR